MITYFGPSGVGKTTHAMGTVVRDPERFRFFQEPRRVYSETRKGYSATHHKVLVVEYAEFFEEALRASEESDLPKPVLDCSPIQSLVFCNLYNDKEGAKIFLRLSRQYCEVHAKVRTIGLSMYPQAWRDALKQVDDELIEDFLWRA